MPWQGPQSELELSSRHMPPCTFGTQLGWPAILPDQVFFLRQQQINLWKKWVEVSKLERCQQMRVGAERIMMMQQRAVDDNEDAAAADVAADDDDDAVGCMRQWRRTNLS